MRAWWGLAASSSLTPGLHKGGVRSSQTTPGGHLHTNQKLVQDPKFFPEPLCPPSPSCQGPERPQGQSALWRTGPSNGPQDPASSKGKISPKAVLDVLMLTWPWT